MTKHHTRRILSEVGRELKRNEPEIVAKVRQKKGGKAAERVKTAILLSKARKRGARIRRKRS